MVCPAFMFVSSVMFTDWDAGFNGVPPVVTCAPEFMKCALNPHRALTCTVARPIGNPRIDRLKLSRILMNPHPCGASGSASNGYSRYSLRERVVSYTPSLSQSSTI